MRCYLMRNGQIQGVTLLKDGPDDELIAQAKQVFEERAKEGFEGVEVWSGTRFVYRSSPKSEAPNSN